MLQVIESIETEMKLLRSGANGLEHFAAINLINGLAWGSGGKGVSGGGVKRSLIIEFQGKILRVLDRFRRWLMSNERCCDSADLLALPTAGETAL